MKASEAIEMLRELIRQHGDLPMLARDYVYYNGVTTAEAESIELYESDDLPTYKYPDGKGFLIRPDNS
jgi:hypothetical protein